jgi:RimJ/RimL family protein N-acetyltransferase
MSDRLLTERLCLRPLSLDDAAPFAALMTPAIARWTGSWSGLESTQAVAARIARCLEEEGLGLRVERAVELRPSGPLIGWIGVKRAEAPDRASIGYWIGEAFFGQGYTREAARAILDEGFATLDVDVIEGVAQLGNTASIAILKGLGMRHLGERAEFASARGTADPCAWYQIERRAHAARLQGGA